MCKYEAQNAPGKSKGLKCMSGLVNSYNKRESNPNKVVSPPLSLINGQIEIWPKIISL